VLPVDDLGFRVAVKQQYGFDELPTAEQLRAIGACWAPYRTVATWYLWRSRSTIPRGEQ
jgi:DNA-3-methyladenine glycosylase II